MERVMIQVDRQLLERARSAAQKRGITFPQLVREALEHELAVRSKPSRPLPSAGVIGTGGQAGRHAYEPDEWR